MTDDQGEMMRRRIVAANWKMNMTSDEAGAFINTIREGINGKEAEVHIIPPSVDIAVVKDALKGTDILVGAQNMYYEDKGAFTGEISADMLTCLGVHSVVIGHSERRNIFSEDDEMINLKVKKALEKGLVPILCCGESLDTREAGKVSEWINAQIESAFSGISAQDAVKCIIAYEPIWAIGTGKVATTDQAQEVCLLIREKIKELYGSETAEDIHILYGGSVKADNCKELFECPDIDGGLVGGASLKPEFVDIVNA